MDLSAWVELDVGSSLWALGVCGLLALVVLCATCVTLSLTCRDNAARVLEAFADVIRAFRRRPRRESGRRRRAGRLVGPTKTKING
jgi:hypothetical protein